MRLECVPEYELKPSSDVAIRDLLQVCFPGYPSGRNYYKQLPSFRYLAWQDDRLAAHAALEHRVINNGGQILRILGLTDFCVSPEDQNQHLASRLLEAIAQLGQTTEVDFILLLSSNPAVYLQNGFRPIDAKCRWVILHQHQTVGVARRRMEQTIMIRSVSGKAWREGGELDFLGPVF